MVSNASDDLPDPDRPVITTSLSRGISTSMFLRLCSRAPLITIFFIAAAGPRKASPQDHPRYQVGFPAPSLYHAGRDGKRRLLAAAPGLSRRRSGGRP